MNTNLILMLAALVLLAISGLLVFCFTESKGKNTPHARKLDSDDMPKPTHKTKENIRTRSTINMENKLVKY